MGFSRWKDNACNALNYMPSRTFYEPSLLFLPGVFQRDLRSSLISSIILQYRYQSVRLHQESTMSRENLPWRCLCFSVASGPGPLFMMVGATLLLVAMFAFHGIAFKDVDKSKKEEPDVGKLIWAGAYLLVAAAICVGSGKPYSIFYASVIAFGCLLSTWSVAHPYFDWAEKLLWIFCMSCLIGEYFYRFCTNRRIRTAYEEEFFSP